VHCSRHGLRWRAERSEGRGGAQGTKAFYDLESLLYFIKEGCTVGTGVYMREAQAKQLIAVSFVDRKVCHSKALSPWCDRT
jgi:hypothetical protein